MYLYAPILKFQGRSWGRGGGGCYDWGNVPGPRVDPLKCGEKKEFGAIKTIKQML